MHMHLGENAQMALTTLRENKMRSFLTVLGVVIGITALLSVVAVLMGVYGDMNAFLSDFGPNTFFIFKFDPGIHSSGRLSREELARKPLTLEDAKAIEELCPEDRKSTRLNSSHRTISYAVFCLKKKKNIKNHITQLEYSH